MDSEFFTARVDDAVCHSARNKTPKFLGFLTPQEAAIADSILKKQCAKYLFYGGYDDAERQFLVCLPDWCDNPDFFFRIIESRQDFCADNINLPLIHMVALMISSDGCNKTESIFSASPSHHD